MAKKMILNHFHPEITTKIARLIGCHEVAAKLLVNRGITTPEEAFTFFNPSLQHLTDPFALKDIKKAVKRIYTAICNKEKILIFGDFDADGITSTVLLNHFLSYVEADVSWYIPHRIREGYSLKNYHIEMAVKQKCDLLITVDCGSDSHDAVKDAIKEDIDIIITDHHEITAFCPPAFAVINPKRKDCKANLDHLAGVGVAFYLIIALRHYLREKQFWEDIPEPNLVEYCDLFAIGTIADMVPLKGENRILSKVGIEIMRQGKREGLKALIEVSRIDQKNIDSDDISFKIAPRINAAGRISHSRICVDLLMEREHVKAEQTAFILDELNKKRQEIEKSIVDEIEKRIYLEPKILKQSSIVMQGSKWNAGVLGIAASKISKQYCRPVVLISHDKSSNNATGSCRSIGKINIYQALCACSDLLENFGGHFMAAGISIKPENIEKFSHCFEEYISKVVTPEDFIPQMIIDSTLNLNEITETLINDVDKLKPFGTDNPEPLFQCFDVKVLSSFVFGTKHRKMMLQQTDKSIVATPIEATQIKATPIKAAPIKAAPIEATPIKAAPIEAIQFNIESEQEITTTPNYFKKITFRLKMNRFGGKNIPQIIIEHIVV